MRVVYCTSCREMIDRKDIESGKAILYNKQSYCPKCTLEASWSDSSRAEPIENKAGLPGVVPKRRTPAPGSPPARRPTSDSLRPAAARGRRPSTGNLAPGVGEPAHATPPRALRQRSAAAATQKKLVILASVGIGGSVFLGIVVVGLLVSRNGGDHDSHEEPGGAASTGGPSAKDAHQILFDRNVEVEEGLDDTTPAARQAVAMWRESLGALEGSPLRSRAMEHLRAACQRFFEKTAREAGALGERGDDAGALALWKAFLETVDLEPWMADARARLAELESRASVPRPDATWAVLFDGTSPGQLCPDPKHYKAWKRNGEVLVGQIAGAPTPNDWIHFSPKYDSFQIAMEYRVLNGGFVIVKQTGFEIGIPAGVDEALRTWHQAIVVCEGGKVRLWIDEREIANTWPVAAGESQVGLVLRPDSEVEIRNVRIHVLR